MPRSLYTLAYLLLLPLMFGRLWWRGRKNPAYRLRWNERLGRYALAPLDKRAVVFHAVSVGEVHAAMPLLEQFLQHYPHIPVVVTTTTPTGSARVQQLLGKRVHHVYLPYDLPFCLNGFFRQFNPRLLVLLETELWPNLLEGCASRQCPVLLVNARLSPKSFASYQRVGALAQRMLQQLSVVAAQSLADGERFVKLGLPAAALQLTGSLKFDLAVQADKVAQAKQLKSQWQQRPVWIAASTREGEDGLVIQAFQRALQQIPALLLVLVPRHPERFTLAAELAASAGLHTVRYSSGDSVRSDTQVLVGDSLGDMHFYYSLADIAFVGGSLVPTGCQNIIEAAALGLPVVTGPSLYNFQAASDALQEAGAMQVVADATELANTLVKLFGDEARRLSMAAQATAVVATNIGATTRTLALIQKTLGD
ncbi:MAG: lipid IV(A) 3-deoxy-D-manno-octulosonic acid transferase [Pseudomonadota bacterium]